jgi:rare lipoprotein A
VIGGVTGFVERYELTTMLVSSGSSASASARIRIEPKIISGSQPSKAVIIGRASWYGRAAAGHKTATGERLDPSKLTAACRQLPLQSRAVVTNLENGRSVGVRINDCGPYTKGRQIDVSKRAAEKLDMADRGTAPVKIQPIATPPRAVYCSNPKSRRRKTDSSRSDNRGQSKEFGTSSERH